MRRADDRTESDRGALPGWRRQPLYGAARSASPGRGEAAADIHRRITGTNELEWLDTTNHIDLYDQPDYVEAAVANIGAWMTTHLDVTPVTGS